MHYELWIVPYWGWLHFTSRHIFAPEFFDVLESTRQQVNECHGVSSVSGVSGVSSVHKGKRFSFSFWFSFIVVSQAMSPPNQARSATNLQFGVSGVVRYETYLKGREWSVWNTCNSLMMTCHNRPSPRLIICSESGSKLRSGCASACMLTTISRLRRRSAFEITGIFGRYGAPVRGFEGRAQRIAPLRVVRNLL